MAESYPVKITFGEMREEGYRGIIVYCRDFACSHNVTMSADRWPDHVRISDVEPSFTCTACGKKGADIRADQGSYVRPEKYRP
ncbi:hypothetical protein H8A97_13175 [Bradyrhizobium sp. Arg62]|uniref:hypothetical protein n=1 Tax=Bradyrhizobium brasilense TaxID=1419277 RepID=UPI001E3DAC88|nr:hypothetical protein [Bradyrhizobium brasilense]MCC8946026.1 hypothetical protein [Bradyrhizobium brasilense]